jgi:menaquinone-dependent protoporphyrinogen oxidase
MVPIYVVYASHDGQAERIALRLGERLRAAGAAAEVRRLAGTETLAEAPLVVLVAAVRYGFHLPAARVFARAWGGRAAPPLAVASVCLTARKPNRRTAADNPYLRAFLKRYGLRPAASAAIAGKLDYPRYRWFDRLMIRLIMMITNGPTDPTTVIEYTDWGQVDAFADDLARRFSPVVASAN